MIEKVEFNNKEMRYFKFGSGKKIMVIIPGLSIKSVMESESAIISMYKMFMDGFKIYCFDRISNPNVGYTINDMANDMIRVFDVLNLKGIYLFGASQGGIISQIIALERKDLIKKLVIASSTSTIDDNITKKLTEFIKLAKEEKKEELVLDFAKIIYPKEYYEKLENVFIDFASDIKKEELDNFIINASALFNANLIDKVSKIKIPFMQVHDEKDKLINIDLAHSLESHMGSNYKLVTLSGYGHVLYDIAPNFKDIMLEFFNK